MSETIVPTTETESVCVLEQTPDYSGRGPVIYLPIIAWSIDADCNALPITRFGKCDPGGAWFVHDRCNNFICSDGTLFRQQHYATSWLKQRQEAAA
jgi:hypothetical protein